MTASESNQRWKKENTVMVGLRLMNKTDMDIIEAIKTDGPIQVRVKELIRLGMEYEKLQKEKPMPLRPVEKKKGMIDLRKVVRGTVDNPGSVPDPD